MDRVFYLIGVVSLSSIGLGVFVWFWAAIFLFEDKD